MLQRGEPVYTVRNTIAMMRAKPAISVGAKTVPKKTALVMVADTRLDRADEACTHRADVFHALHI